LTNKARTSIGEIIQAYPPVGTVSSDPAIPKVIETMQANGDILLLPGMVHAFALRDRKWSMFLKERLQDC
jgi:hypothetical protein